MTHFSKCLSLFALLTLVGAFGVSAMAEGFPQTREGLSACLSAVVEKSENDPVLPLPFLRVPNSRIRYNAMVEMPRGYLSGIMILLNDEGEVRGSLFNEFGISALDFSYYPERRRVKIHHAVKMIDKWYIKRTLRADLAHLFDTLTEDGGEYTNAKRHIHYLLTPLHDDTQQ